MIGPEKSSIFGSSAIIALFRFCFPHPTKSIAHSIAAINAIKEIDKKIIALTKQLIKVETQISKLEQENVSLKSQVNELTMRINKLKNQ